LFEVIVIMVVLAVIAGIAAPRYMDMRARAGTASEAGVVKSVKSALSMYRLNGSASGSAQWPATLDPAPANARAIPSVPFFTAVLDLGIAHGWAKGTTPFEYVAPTGTMYVYDPGTGLFGTVAEVSAASLVAPGGGPPGLAYTTMSSWTALGASINGFVGSGYGLSGDEMLLNDSWPSFTESARRVALFGGQHIQAGTYTLDLDTALTNYYNQLNYWIVIGIKNGKTLNLSGNTLRWNGTYPGVKYLHKDYAPPEKSDGTYYSYSQTFTVSAADAAEYDQIVVVLAGSRFNGQMLGWRNVSLRKQ
jgi:type II secretory pathway pseudopilin PulG